MRALTRCLALAALAALASCPPEPADPFLPVRLRVVSYNVQHGKRIDGSVDIVHAAGVMGVLDPDIVAVQELDRHTKRSEGADQLSELTTLTGLSGTFGSAKDFDGGQFGNGLLTRDTPLGHVVQPLPRGESGEGGEPRSVLRADFLTEYEEYSVLCTHFDADDDMESRIAAAQALIDIADEDPDRPMILAGTFGDVPTSALLERLGSHWTSACEPTGHDTYPARDPQQQLDYIMVRPAHRWNILSCEVAEEELASDHRPLVVVLQLDPPPLVGNE